MIPGASKEKTASGHAGDEKFDFPFREIKFLE